MTADFDAQSAVERELVLRLASLLWRLRRVTAIEAGLFKEQARQLLGFRQGPREQQSISRLHPKVVAENEGEQDREGCERPISADGSSSIDPADQRTRLSHGLLLVSPTCRPIRLTGLAGMRPPFGGRPARFDHPAMPGPSRRWTGTGAECRTLKRSRRRTLHQYGKN